MRNFFSLLIIVSLIYYGAFLLLSTVNLFALLELENALKIELANFLNYGFLFFWLYIILLGLNFFKLVSLKKYVIIWIIVYTFLTVFLYIYTFVIQF